MKSLLLAAAVSSVLTVSPVQDVGGLPDDCSVDQLAALRRIESVVIAADPAEDNRELLVSVNECIEEMDEVFAGWFGYSARRAEYLSRSAEEILSITELSANATQMSFLRRELGREVDRAVQNYYIFSAVRAVATAGAIIFVLFIFLLIYAVISSAVSGSG